MPELFALSIKVRVSPFVCFLIVRVIICALGLSVWATDERRLDRPVIRALAMYALFGCLLLLAGLLIGAGMETHNAWPWIDAGFQLVLAYFFYPVRKEEQTNAG